MVALTNVEHIFMTGNARSKIRLTIKITRVATLQPKLVDYIHFCCDTVCFIIERACPGWIYIYIYRNNDSPCVGIKYEKKRMESQHFHINLIL